MKIVAVFEKKIEVFVELGEFDTWEEAAKAATAIKPPTAPPDQLYLERIWRDDDGLELTMGHEVIGICPVCRDGIVDGCGRTGCTDKHGAKGGWVSTEHGHRTWCSQGCRDKDPEDPEHGR